MRRMSLFGLLLIGLISGCGGGDADNLSYAPVSGVVTMDGRPLEGATVAFNPTGKGAMSMAITDAAGKFTLKSTSGKPGAVVGDHTVSVSLVIELGGGSTAAPSATDLATPLPNELPSSERSKAPVSTTRYVVPERYSKPGALTAKVPDGGLTDHKLDLQSK